MKEKCHNCGNFEAQEGSKFCLKCNKEFFEDDGSDCEDENEVPDYYHCLCCGHDQNTNDWGGQCEICTACALDEVYF